MKTKLAKKAILFTLAIVMLTLTSIPPHLSVSALSSKRAAEITVVFNSQTLPVDAADRISAAGGQMVRSIPQIGVAVARPAAVSGDALIGNLRADPSIYRAGYDLVAQGIMPAAMEADGSSAVTSHASSSADPLPPPPTTIAGAPARDRFYIEAAGNVPSNQWAIRRVGGFGTAGYGPSGGAWDITTGSPSVTVAVLASGVSSFHPDVASKIVDAQSTLFGVDPTSVGSDPTFDDGSPEDQEGQGTWAASLTAGSLDPEGGLGAVVGVAPGVSIANLKVLVRTPIGACGIPGADLCGQFSWVTAAIVYAAVQRYQVATLAVSGSVDLTNKDDQATYVALVRATDFAFNRGTLLIAAAGNDGINLDSLGTTVWLPASLPNVIAVMATTNPACIEATPPGTPCMTGPDGLAFYSNFGSSLHGISAPGGSFPGSPPGGGFIGATGFLRGACSPGKESTPNSGCGGLGRVYYIRAISTGGAASLVAGAAALVYTVRPSLRANEVRQILYGTAKDIGKPGYDAFFNFGLVDATAAVLAALSFQPVGG